VSRKCRNWYQNEVYEEIKGVDYCTIASKPQIHLLLTKTDTIVSKSLVATSVHLYATPVHLHARTVAADRAVRAIYANDNKFYIIMFVLTVIFRLAWVNNFRLGFYLRDAIC